MFLNKKYILANELVQKMNIHIANVSMLRQQFEDDGDDSTLLKMNNCTFIKSDSYKLPNNFISGILNNTFTDVSNKLPCTYVKTEYELTEKELFKSGIVTGKETIASKEFYVFSDDFVKQSKNKVIYILDEKETNECYQKNQIEGYIQVSKNKFITWYSLRK